MKRKIVAGVLIWVCVFAYAVFAQKENYIWYFGDSAGVDFNSGSPVALTNSAMFQLEGCASISDANGNLLFYTDGVSVWDSSHTQMPNGNSLLGGLSSTQSALIVPFPGNNLLYYIFTPNNGQGMASPLFSYSIVDMSLNNGKGDVTLKNIYLLSPVSEQLTAVKHSNGIDVWVMVRLSNSNSHYAYLITSTGISPSPVISNVGSTLFVGAGYMKFSPDGSKFAEGIPNCSLYDFNTSTGIVSNQKILSLPTGGAYGIEFSPMGNYLYCCLFNGTYGEIHQWDITSNNDSIINSSHQLIANTFSDGAMQLGPDGKIYVSLFSSYLGVINAPELPGIQCNYIDSGIWLAGKYTQLGLPNFITSYFLPTGINTNTKPQSQLSLFPNPATTHLTIQSSSKTNNTTVILHNTLGEQLLAKQFKEKATVDISHLPQGIYFVTVSNEKERVVRKIIKAP
ncbi:MAG: T9SS type A sorting domain-containing protein [Bacteroidia bacterium]